ncbi:conserved hypothetical protein [Stenotrophomonas maltophilia]
MEQLGEEGQLQCLGQEAHAGRATGAALEADHPHHRAHVAEAPQLEGGLQVHQVLAQRVLAPVAVGVLVDAFEDRLQCVVSHVRLGPVVGLVDRRHGMAEPGQVLQELLVQARRLQHGAQLRLPGRVMLEHLQHLRVLVAQQELDVAVLQRLEARRWAQHVAEAHVLGRGQRFQHRPLLGQLAQHLLAARQHLAALPDFIALQEADCGTQLMAQQLQPQLRGLVLDDEEHLVMVRRAGQRLLRAEQLVQPQVAAVGEASLQVGVDAGFEIALVVVDGHGRDQIGGGKGSALPPRWQPPGPYRSVRLAVEHRPIPGLRVEPSRPLYWRSARGVF